MARFDRMLCACAAFVLVGACRRAAAVAKTAADARGAGARRRPAQPLAPRRAARIALGLMAQVAAVRPETMRFATELETDFRVLDRRILAIAEALGIGENRLRQAYADQNTAALDGRGGRSPASLHAPR